MSGDILTAIGGLIAVILGALGAFLARWAALRRDEILLLRDEVARLHKRVDDLTLENIALHCEISRLRLTNARLIAILAAAGINIPPEISEIANFGSSQQEK